MFDNATTFCISVAESKQSGAKRKTSTGKEDADQISDSIEENAAEDEANLVAEAAIW